MATEMKLFLRQGIRLYSDAQHTLAAFEQEMEKLLKTAVQSRSRWSPLKKYHMESPFSGGDNPRGIGWWVEMDVTGRSSRGEEVRIDSGLWWDAPPERGARILYTSFRKQPKRVLRFKWPAGKQGISSFDKFGRTFLYVPMPNSGEIEKPLNHLLDALLVQLR
jgi:hypothetical protein